MVEFKAFDVYFSSHVPRACSRVVLYIIGLGGVFSVWGCSYLRLQPEHNSLQYRIARRLEYSVHLHRDSDQI